jgi:hypothetical protein
MPTKDQAQATRARTLRSLVVPTFRNYLFIKKHKFSIDIYDGPRTRSLTKRKLFVLVRCGPGDGRRSGPARARPWTLRDLAPMPVAVADVVSCIAGRCGAWKMDGVAFAP